MKDTTALDMFRERFEKEMKYTDAEMQEIREKGGYKDPQIDARLGLFIAGWHCAVNVPEQFWQQFFIEQILVVRNLFEHYLTENREQLNIGIYDFETRSLEFFSDETNWYFKCFVVGFSGYFNQVRKAMIQ